MNALITGASGSLAPYVSRRLQAHGVNVFLSARRPINRLDPGVRFKPADLVVADEVAALLRWCRPKIIIHLAGPSGGSDAELEQGIVHVTNRLLNAVRVHCPTAHVVLAGSAAEYGIPADGEIALKESDECKPISAYGRAKHKMVHDSLQFADRVGLSCSIARPFNIVARTMSPLTLLGSVIDQLKRQRNRPRAYIEVGSLSAYRDFVSAVDVATGMVQMAFLAKRNEVFNLCSGEARSLRDIVNMTLELSAIEADLDESGPGSPRVGATKIFGTFEKAAELLDFVPHTPLETELTAALAVTRCT